MSERIVPCVGAVVHDRAGRLLLIRRGREPGSGLWSLPGGRVEPRESDQQAVVREVAEETGLRVSARGLVGRVRRHAPDGSVYEIADYRCELDGSGPSVAAAGDGANVVAAAGDDADEVAWVTAADYAALPVVPGLTEALTAWNVLPR